MIAFNTHSVIFHYLIKIHSIRDKNTLSTIESIGNLALNRFPNKKVSKYFLGPPRDMSFKHLHYTSTCLSSILVQMSLHLRNLDLVENRMNMQFVHVHVYIAYYTSKSGIWLVISRVASYFHEPKASANTAYE